MRAGRPLALAFFLLGWSSAAQAGDPVETAVKYHEAMQAHRCKEAWALSSKARQERIRGEEESCGRIGKFKPGTARLVRKVGDEAVVSAMFRGRPGRDYFDVGAAFAEYTEELDLIREDGAWKVELPRPKLQSKQARLLVPAGAVDYRMDPVVGGIHHKLEVAVASRVPRDALEAVLRDPKAWARALPSFKSIGALAPAGGGDRALLAFADPSTAIPVTVMRGGRLVDPKADSTSLEWTVDKDVDAPIYMRGAWILQPAPEGTTRVSLTLVINPRHWPRRESLFSATRLAKSLDDFQLAAGKKP